MDGSVDLLDVAPFVELLANGGFKAEADINQDGNVDLLDVQPFVDIFGRLIHNWHRFAFLLTESFLNDQF